MPYPGWSDKRIRQFQHIKQSLLAQGRSPEKAEEIASCTVNKVRSAAGETRRSEARERRRRG